MGATTAGKSVSDNATVRPVILCGGSGSRLWPLSSSVQPKQLLALHSAKTMLQDTVRRVASEEFKAPIVVTAAEHRLGVSEQLHAGDVGAHAIILEPEGRNTAAAIALACFLEASTDPDQLLLVMPSDHVIGDVEAFRSAVRAGVSAALAGAIVMFGITPTRGETGFGYIEAGNEIAAYPGVRHAVGFVEKPDLATALAYVQGGDHFWNGGIFLFRASTMIEELRSHAPDVASACEKAIQNAAADGEFLRPARQEFLRAPAISIDYVVMEKTDRACVVEADMGWSDVGSWQALWEISDKDENANAVTGKVLALETSGSLIRSESEATIATLGVENLVIVATRDAILIVPRHRSQELKDLVREMATGALSPDRKPVGQLKSADG